MKTKYYWTWLWFYNFKRKFTTCMVWTSFIFLSHLQIFAVQRHFTHQSNSLQHGLILQSNFVYQSSLNQWNYKQQKNIMKWNGRKYTWMNLHFTKHMNNIFRVQLAILDIYIWSKLIFEQLHNTMYSYLHIMLNL